MKYPGISILGNRRPRLGCERTGVVKRVKCGNLGELVKNVGGSTPSAEVPSGVANPLSQALINVTKPYACLP